MSTTPRKSSLNQNLIGLGIVFILLGLVGSYQFLVPKVQTIKATEAATQSQIESTKMSISTLTKAKTDLEKAKTNLKNKGIDVDATSGIVPKFEDVPGLYLQMESLVAKEKGVSKLTYQIGTPVSDPNGVKIPLTLSAVGRYANLYDFIGVLQTLPRPILISALSFSQSAGDSKAVGVLSLSVTGSVRARSLSSAYQTTTTTNK